MIIRTGQIYQESEIAPFRERGYEFEQVEGGFTFVGYQGKTIAQLQESYAPEHPPRSAEAEARFEKFKAALEALCIEHGVTISTSGYDSLQVLPIGNEPIYADRIENELN